MPSAIAAPDREVLVVLDRPVAAEHPDDRLVLVALAEVLAEDPRVLRREDLRPLAPLLVHLVAPRRQHRDEHPERLGRLVDDPVDVLEVLRRSAWSGRCPSSGRSPYGFGSVSPPNSASTTAWMTVKPLVGAVVEVGLGVLAVQAVKQLPGGVAEVEERRAVRPDEEPLVLADLQRRPVGGAGGERGSSEQGQRSACSSVGRRIRTCVAVLRRRSISAVIDGRPPPPAPAVRKPQAAAVRPRCPGGRTSVFRIRPSERRADRRIRARKGPHDHPPDRRRLRGRAVIAYVTYGRLVVRWLGLDPSRPTPAVEYGGRQRLRPRAAPVVLGGHFTAIAAAGPVVGPILAGLAFGWLPALLWIVLGAIFIGGVHDAGGAVRQHPPPAASITQVVREHMSRPAYVTFLLFVWISLIYVIIAFADVTAGTLRQLPAVRRCTSTAQPRTFTLNGGAVAIGATAYLVLSIAMGLFLRFTKLPWWVGCSSCASSLLALTIWKAPAMADWLAAHGLPFMNTQGHRRRRAGQAVGPGAARLLLRRQHRADVAAAPAARRHRGDVPLRDAALRRRRHARRRVERRRVARDPLARRSPGSTTSGSAYAVPVPVHHDRVRRVQRVPLDRRQRHDQQAGPHRARRQAGRLRRDAAGGDGRGLRAVVRDGAGARRRRPASPTRSTPAASATSCTCAASRCSSPSASGCSRSAASCSTRSTSARASAATCSRR